MTPTLPQQSGRDLERNVIELARLLGWRCAHFRPALTKHGWRTPVSADGAGFPDLLLVHDQHGILVRELKAGTGRVSAAQQAWLDLFRHAGVSAEIWTDTDWQEGRILAELQGDHTRLEEIA